MGCRIAPILAVLFMHHIESVILQTDPPLYVRYIDDILIATTTTEELAQHYSCLNNVHPNIHLTIERPVNNKLPFLNFAIYLEEGRIETGWYKKQASKNIIINRRSAHPAVIKRNVLANMVHAAESLSSSVKRKVESLKMAEQIALSNGYEGLDYRPSFWVRGGFERTKTIFKIPFISESFTAAVGTLIRKLQLPIAVVCQHPRTLKDMLTSNRIYDQACEKNDCLICSCNFSGSCKKTGCVYKIICECGMSYIGETGRPLHERIDEHIRALNNPSCKSYVDAPLARHRVVAHRSGQPRIEVQVLHTSTSTIKRKIIEAMWIRSEQPALNMKAEMEDAIKLLH